jgi:hypothetical protein
MGRLAGEGLDEKAPLKERCAPNWPQEEHTECLRKRKRAYEPFLMMKKRAFLSQLGFNDQKRG